jgi:hypothetical protein
MGPLGSDRLRARRHLGGARSATHPGHAHAPALRTNGGSAGVLDTFAERTLTLDEDAERERKWLRHNSEQEQEWLRQLSLIYGGLIIVGMHMVQPFLAAAALDLSAKICVIAFAVAVPILAALVIVNRQEAFRRRLTMSRRCAPSPEWSPVSGTSCGSPAWGSW